MRKNEDQFIGDKLKSCIDSNAKDNLKHSSQYFSYLDKLVTLYYKVQPILLTSLNDIFLQSNLESLSENELIKDTIEVIVNSNNDLNVILHTNRLEKNTSDINFLHNKYHEHKENLFIKYSKDCEELLLDELIEYPSINSDSSNKNIASKLKGKKNYEVEKLSKYMLDIIDKENIKNLIEMGCGKSYLTDSILLNDDMVYIGLDRKDDLIEKISKVNRKDNMTVLNHNITLANFNDIFKTEIEPKLVNSEEITEEISNNTNKNRIMLFGLHSCGNLTSDTIKIFFQNNSFTHLVIVGCCLNLLKEHINQHVQKDSKLFRDNFDNIGFDNKGNFLEQTLLYEYDYAEVGFPLSLYVRNAPLHKDLFFTRTVRNASMQSFPKKEDCLIDSKKNLFYKKFFYRMVLQSFFENNFLELKNFYGFGKIDIGINDDFNQYLSIVFKNLKKIFKTKENKQHDSNKLLEKLEKLQADVLNDGSIVSEHVKRFTQVENILWAVYVIRLRFAKIIEYIIALDRVIFMLEKGISNVHLVKIFEEDISVRNILIYATK